MKKDQLIIGLENFLSHKDWQKDITGDVGYLCHSASVDHHLNHGLNLLKDVFGDRLKKVFGPQHGFVTDVQDNMIETDHFQHPYYDLPIYSLYSETRIPTDEMLEGINTMIVDLQDVGTRVYTYIWTMTLLMEACGKNDIEVIILDRPNPIGGELIEGNLLDMDYKSFVGRMPIPQRHGMTIGEVAHFAKKYHGLDCDLSVVPLQNWNRKQYFTELNRAWINPSPNLPTPEGALSFVGTVLYEGTNISEGRGTTRSLEVVGHPKIEPHSFLEHIQEKLNDTDLRGFVLRPVNFQPMFQKHAGKTCGGFHIHITDREWFHSWRLGQFLCRELYHFLGDDFKWNDMPYEYEHDKLAIDLINGTDKIRRWVENNGSMEELEELELIGREDFLNKRADILLY